MATVTTLVDGAADNVTAGNGTVLGWNGGLGTVVVVSPTAAYDSGVVTIYASADGTNWVSLGSDAVFTAADGVKTFTLAAGVQITYGIASVAGAAADIDIYICGPDRDEYR